MSNAPGHPGVPPRWTSSAKGGVGTALSANSRIWFTISLGIVNEVYHPYIDRANTRDLEFLVADGSEFFSEEKRDTTHHIQPLKQGVPGYRVTNACGQGRYRIVKTVIADPRRDVLLQQVRFEPLQGSLSEYALYALLAPHIGNQGYGNDGWIGDYKGVPMLFAAREDVALALACSSPWRARSCGYVGVSDGWQDIHDHKKMTRFYPEARDGNIALTGEIDLAGCDGACVVALAFGGTAAEAGQQARAALLCDFAEVAGEYVREWERFQSHCRSLSGSLREEFDLYRVSTAVLKTHESKRFHGGMIASLSIPWGYARGDHTMAGYHLVWPRDQVEAAGAILATGDAAGAREALSYMICTQEPEGHWPQNMWLDGTPYWRGVQSDQTAYFILLADGLRRRNELGQLDPWPAVRKAACFLLDSGPVTQQDRWEENCGFSPYTLAIEVAALLAAADFADEAGESDAAAYLRESADTWNTGIESWTYVTGTDLAGQVGVEGYYIRIAPPDVPETGLKASGTVTIKNRPEGENHFPAAEIVSPDALGLVRFGLRAPDDPRIVNTVKVIDATLKTETATGPVWHRYTHDGYGEHEDGRPFDGTGVGRGWPLLAGERAHYELAAGNPDEARRLLGAMTAQSSPGGLLPEQVWDTADIPERTLFNGQPSGAAMPLVWAHAEYLKLVRSLNDEEVFDTPPQPVRRYQIDKTDSPFVIWRFQHKSRAIPAGKTLRVEVIQRAVVHWSPDNWRTVHDTATHDTRLGIHVADLPIRELPAGTEICFTFCWCVEERWEGRNFAVRVE